MKETALKAYEKAVESGLVHGRRMEVFADICRHGPSTQLESWRRVAPNSNSGAVTTRFSELERMQLIMVVGSRKDEFTGMENSVYYVTGKDPVALPKKNESQDDYTKGWNAALGEIINLAVEKQLTNKIGYQTRITIQELCTEIAE